MPSGDITPQMLDRILENQSFTPKTDALFKQVRGECLWEHVICRKNGKGNEGQFLGFRHFVCLCSYYAFWRCLHIEQKDEQFVSKLTGDFRSMASETVNKEVLLIILIYHRNCL